MAAPVSYADWDCHRELNDSLMQAQVQGQFGGNMNKNIAVADGNQHSVQNMSLTCLC